MKFGLVVVVGDCGQDTSSQGEKDYCNLVKTLLPIWEAAGK